jgi:hypothetical protein
MLLRLYKAVSQEQGDMDEPAPNKAQLLFYRNLNLFFMLL